jgi:hypothetical protein
MSAFNHSEIGKTVSDQNAFPLPGQSDTFVFFKQIACDTQEIRRLGFAFVEVSFNQHYYVPTLRQ